MLSPLAMLSPLSTAVPRPDTVSAPLVSGGSSRCAALLAKLESQRPPDCVVFYHIPKTGGGGFSESRVKDLPGLKTWKHYESLPTAPPYEATVATLLQGHWTPRFGTQWLRRNCLSVTMLRDAVEHAMSAFYFHGHETPQWERCLAGDETGCGGCCAEQYRDGQTRQLAALGGGTDVYSGALGASDSVLPASALRDARVNLQAMDLVGTTTNHAAFAEMVDLLLNRTSAMLGAWTPSLASAAAASAAAAASTGTHESHSEKEERQLPAQLVSQIAAANSHDAQLFAYAAQLEAEDAACLRVPLLQQRAAAAEAMAQRQAALETASSGNHSAGDEGYVAIAITDDGVPPFPGTPAAKNGGSMQRLNYV